MEPEGPIFNEKQAGAILRRAAELSSASSTGGSSGGTTLADMERIAAEIGIDAAHVRAAAAELTRSPAGNTAGIIDLERVVPGELSDEAWEAVVADLRRTFSNPGTTSQVGLAREWSLKGEMGHLHASLVSRQGHTRIQILENHSSALGLSWVMWAFFSVITMVVAAGGGAAAAGPEQALINFLIVGGISGASFLGIREANRRWCRTQRQRMDGLISRITGRVSQQPRKVAAAEEPLQLSSTARAEHQTIARQELPTS